MKFFGSYDTSQPTPIDFENNLAYNYSSILSNHIFFEDESRTIGRLVIPEKFYNINQVRLTYEQKINLTK